MLSTMSTSKDGGMVPPRDRGGGAVEEEKTVASTSDVSSPRNSGFSTMRPTEKATWVGVDESDKTRISDNASDSRVLKLENEDNKSGEASGGQNKHDSSVPRMLGNSKKSGSRSGKLDHKKNRSAVEDYDSILSAFDEFAAREKDEAVGHGFKIGDMVWGKVKSHPWWPGFIHNEAFASPSVRRGKHEGHVLVAFFGDSSYGWFDPAELIPFEENFADKSKQTTSRSFLNAVEEALDELSRRSSLGLACRCRNEFNFWPSNVEGHFIVDVGDPEPGVYVMSQISKARGSFQTRQMLSFIREMALEPRNDRHWSIDFVKNKATAVAYRKAQFEEFDETYAQAFGNVPVRPPRPTAPVAVDPSKAPLSGRLVFAEAVGKVNVSVKPVKTKDQVDKEKILFKRRDESIQMKSKKASASQTSYTPRPIFVDGHHSGIREHAHQASESGIADSQHQPITTDTKPSEGSRKLIESGTKKVKVRKRPAGEIMADNAFSVKKKKKKNGVSTETGVKRREAPLAVSNCTVAVDNVSAMPPDVQLVDNDSLDIQKKGTASSQSEQEADFVKVELQMLVNDLCGLALNPFHGEQRSCPDVIKHVFLKFRSLVYQKSLVLAPLAESEVVKSNSSRLPAEKPNDNIVKPAPTLDDPTKDRSKWGPHDRPDDVKRKKLDLLERVKRKKVDDSLDAKKKKIEKPKLLVAERKIIQRPTEPEVLPEAAKLEPKKRTGPVAKGAAKPTMLFMKFPAGATLPSGFELKAKFARFGPLDPSGTRIFWKSHTCRLVYQHRIDAQAAMKFAVENGNLFGNTNLRCFLREMDAEGAEPEAVKLKEDVSVGDSQARESAGEQKVGPRITSRPIQHPQSAAQLKSCLKKPCGDEGGNGGGRGARVKFVLGGEVKKSSKGELLFNESKKNDLASYPHVATSSSSIHSLDLTSKILPTKFNAHSSTSSFQKVPASMPPPSEHELRPFSASSHVKDNDIAQQMLKLLTRCNEVVNNLGASLGYMPYHPL